MIIEEEQKVEVVEDSTQTEKKEEFKQIPNDTLEKKSNRWIIVICIFLLSFLLKSRIILGKRLTTLSIGTIRTFITDS